MTEKDTKFQERYPYTFNILAICGGLAILNKSFHFLKYMNSVNWFRSFSHSKITEKYGKGSWALISGATDGIGKEYASRLASLGYNIILIGRSTNKLQEVSGEIEKIHNIKTKQILFDLNESDQVSKYETLLKEIANDDISFLVNSAGITNTALHENLSDKEMLEMIKINCIAPTILCNKILPLMKKREKKSAIINISSIMGDYPAPYLASYSASKAYLSALSNSLNIESSQKIDVLSVNPYYVSTKMIRYQGVDFQTRSPSEIVDASLRDLGRRKVTHGHLNHEIINNILKNAPERIRDNYFNEKMSKVASQIQAIKLIALKRRKNTEKDK